MFSVPGNEYTALIHLASNDSAELRKAKGITAVEHDRIKTIAEFVAIQSANSVKNYEGSLSYEEDTIFKNKLKSLGVIASKGIDDCSTYHFAGTTVRVFANTNELAVNIGVDSE